MSHHIKALIAILFDAGVAFASLWLAVLLRYDFDTSFLNSLNLSLYATVYTGICVGFYYHFKFHRSMWRYTTARELIRFSYATLFAMATSALLLVATVGFEGIPRSVIIILPLLQVALSSGPRIILRLWHDRVFQTALMNKKDLNNALIVGVSNSADLFIREYHRKRTQTFKIVGAVDKDPNQVGRLFHGVPVFDTNENLNKVLTQLDKKGFPVQTLLIANLVGEALKQVVDIATVRGLEVKRIPSVSNLKDGKKLTDLKPVMIEDLLGRDPVQLDNSSITSMIRGETVLVTGAGGSIGRELCRQIATHNPEHILLLDHSEDALYHIDMEFAKKWPNIKRTCLLVDIKNKDDIFNTLENYKPKIIFHAAAYKHVPMIESNPISGIENNLLGTKNLTDAAIQNNIPKMVMVSTDKAVNPTNVMGATKRAAEIYSLNASQGTKTEMMAVRFGNVLGSNGSVIPLFRKQITEGGPITVTHKDATRYFMTIPEASQLILQAAAKGSDGNLFMLDMGDSVKIMHLAEQMVTLSGLKPYEDIDIQVTGLRPGEKLYEELWYDAEGMDKTDMEKTFLVQPKGPEKSEVLIKVDAIETACIQQDPFKAVQNLKSLVKEYQPAANSPYTALNNAASDE